MTKKAVGRPSRGGPTVSVSADGRGIAWCDGVFQGDRDLVRMANQIAEWEWEVRLHPRGPVVTANSVSPIGAAAAMVATAMGRAVIVKAPDSVWETFPPDDELEDSEIDFEDFTPVEDDENIVEYKIKKSGGPTNVS